MLKNTFSPTVKGYSNVFPALSETLCFSSCLFKAPPPDYSVAFDWSRHTCLTQHH